eukprot:8274787-Alexandrium_andersonii.AAC.1
MAFGCRTHGTIGVPGAPPPFARQGPAAAGEVCMLRRRPPRPRTCLRNSELGACVEAWRLRSTACSARVRDRT